MLSGIIAAFLARGLDAPTPPRWAPTLTGEPPRPDSEHGSGLVAGDLPRWSAPRPGRTRLAPQRTTASAEAPIPLAQGLSRPAWAEIDVGAVTRNAAVLSRVVAPSQLCAVVKAHGYGHGGPAVAKATLAGGATRLAVALVDEGIELRQHGVTGSILLLSECGTDAIDAAMAADLTPTLYTHQAVEQFARAARAAQRPTPVHVKVDTGMHRVGAPPPDVASLVKAVADDPFLSFEGLWTHFPVADGQRAEDRTFTEGQLERSNGPATSWLPSAWCRHCAMPPTPPAPSPSRRPATTWSASARSLRLPAWTGRCTSAFATADAPPPAGHVAQGPRGGRCGTLRCGSNDPPTGAAPAAHPLGGGHRAHRVRRRGAARPLHAGLRVLIGGRRRPLAGMVTMDQIVVDCGDDTSVRPGDEVVLLGRQGDEEITADEWAGLLGTISYEVLCGVGPRVPRVTPSHGDGAPVPSVSPLRPGNRCRPRDAHPFRRHVPRCRYADG